MQLGIACLYRAFLIVIMVAKVLIVIDLENRVEMVTDFSKSMLILNHRLTMGDHDQIQWHVQVLEDLKHLIHPRSCNDIGFGTTGHPYNLILVVMEPPIAEHY